MLVWTNFFALSLSLSLSQDRLDRASPFHSLSSSPFLLRVPRVLLSVSLSLYIYIPIRDSISVSPFASALTLFVESSSPFAFPSALPLPLPFFFFSIVHSPAPLALQTLLADEARFVLNFLNFIFRGFPKFSLPVSIFIFIESLSSIYPPPLDDGSRYNLIRQ